MAGWDFGMGAPQQFGGIGGSGFSLFGFNPGFTQANPYTQGWMGQTGNEQNQLMQMLFGGGGGGAGMLSQYMNPMSQGGFMNQFLSTTPALQGLTRSASEGELGRAMTLGKQGQEAASSGFSGFGSRYSGANLYAGNKAYQDVLGDLSGKIASENFGLLNNLYGNTLNQYAGAQGQGLQNLFSLYGLNAQNLAGAAAPMIQANPSLFDKILQGLGAAGGAAAGAGSLAKAGGLAALFTG